MTDEVPYGFTPRQWADYQKDTRVEEQTDSIYYALKDGQVVPVEEMTEEMWKEENRRVASTLFAANGELVPEGRKSKKALWFVSTVFLVINHAFDGGTPILFETMVFQRQGSWRNSTSWTDLHCERYATLEEAKAGHERIAASLQTALRLGVQPKREDFTP